MRLVFVFANWPLPPVTGDTQGRDEGDACCNDFAIPVASSLRSPPHFHGGRSHLRSSLEVIRLCRRKVRAISENAHSIGSTT